MKYLWLILFCAQIKVHAAGVNESSCGFLKTFTGTRNFQLVQMVRRNENVGEHDEQDLVFKQWIEISDNAGVGVDKSGRVISLLKLSDRTIARLLSGGERIENLFLSGSRGLLAVNRAGEVLRFQHGPWRHSPLSEIVRTHLLNWSVESCFLSAAIFVYSLSTNFDASAAILSSGLGYVALALTNSAAASRKYEVSNESPNGFVKTNLHWPDLRVEDVEAKIDGNFDYRLRSGGLSMSLLEATRELPAAEPVQLDVTCEDELTARGVPARMYSTWPTR